MPAQLDDPTTPRHYRRSGVYPHPTASSALPPSISPQQLHLRDGTIATIFPFSSPSQLPTSLIQYVCDMLGAAIEDGDSYPMLEPLPVEIFTPYWFGVFGAVLLKSDLETGRTLLERTLKEGGQSSGIDWEGTCLGSFYTKPNYPGRSSHVCNAGFLVAESARGKGVGKKMGEVYLEWAPKLGYTYSVFNLVYESNVASCRIWDSLGFQRIGRVPGCGNLKTSPEKLIDSIVYGKELNVLDQSQRSAARAQHTAAEDLASATVT